MEQLPLSVGKPGEQLSLEASVYDPTAVREVPASIFDRYSPAQLARYKAFHNDNLHVYERFQELVFQMRKSGRKKYSARTIFEVMRWDYDLRTTGEDFKISNDFIPIYVRLLIYRQPFYRDFFSLKGFDLPD